MVKENNSDLGIKPTIDSGTILAKLNRDAAKAEREAMEQKQGVNQSFGVRGFLDLPGEHVACIEIQKAGKDRGGIIDLREEKYPRIFVDVTTMESRQRLDISVANWPAFKAAVDTYVAKFEQIQPESANAR